MSNAARIVRPAESRVRAPRVTLATDLTVDAKTLGTNTTYRLSSGNVSKSGLLLQWHNDSRVPFIVNTLVEMTIDPGTGFLRQPVNCLGKIVRREGAMDGPSSFGVRIIQIDNADLEVWETCVGVLERDARHLVSESIGDMDVDENGPEERKLRHALTTTSGTAKH